MYSIYNVNVICHTFSFFSSSCLCDGLLLIVIQLFFSTNSRHKYSHSHWNAMLLSSIHVAVQLSCLLDPFASKSHMGLFPVPNFPESLRLSEKRVTEKKVVVFCFSENCFELEIFQKHMFWCVGERGFLPVCRHQTQHRHRGWR